MSADSLYARLKFGEIVNQAISHCIIRVCGGKARVKLILKNLENLKRTVSGTQKATMVGQANYVLAVAFSPDGRTLASANSAPTLKLWEVSTARIRAKSKGSVDGSFSVTFSPDGRTLAVGGFDRTVRLWDFRTRTAPSILKGHRDVVKCVAYSPDGRTLASGGLDGTIILWDVAHRKRKTR